MSSEPRIQLVSSTMYQNENSGGIVQTTTGLANFGYTTPMKSHKFPIDPICAIHFQICDSSPRYAELRLIRTNYGWRFNKSPISKRCPSYVAFVFHTGTTTYRYFGARSTRPMLYRPCPLDLARCTTRDEVIAELVRAGIEQNPGPFANFLLFDFRFNDPVVPNRVADAVYEVDDEDSYSADLAAYYAEIAEYYDELTFAEEVRDAGGLEYLQDYRDFVANDDFILDEGVRDVEARAANALAHATNGNSRYNNAQRKRLNQQAFNFDPSDPHTWKFDHRDCMSFVAAVRDARIVKDHTPEWVAEKLLMRRGVKIRDAYAMVCERYNTPYTPTRTFHVPKVEVNMPPPIPDVAPPVATKLAMGDALNSADRRAIKRATYAEITKQSGYFDLLTGKSITTASSDVAESISLAGLHAKAAGAEVAESINNLATKTSRAFSGLSSSLSNVQVTHNLNFNTGLPDLLSKLPPTLHTFISIIIDTLPMIVTDDPMVVLASQPALLLKYGFLTSAMLTALVHFVKKFKKWIGPEHVTKQAGNAPIDEHILTTLYNVVYAIFVGSLPTSAPGNLKDRVMQLNALATLAKNANTGFAFFLDAFKYVADWIYETITGHRYYTEEERVVLTELSVLKHRLRHFMDQEFYEIPDLEELSVIYRQAHALTARLQLLDLPKPATELRNLIRSITDFHRDIALPTELQTPQAPIPLLHLQGDGGVGKSILMEFIAAALSAIQDWPLAQPKEYIHNFESDYNFQIVPAPTARLLLIDDPLVVQDPEAVAATIKTLYRIGNGKPQAQEGAGTDEKGRIYNHFKLAVLITNLIRSDLANNHDQSLARRFLAQLIVTINEKFKRVGTNELDPSKVNHTNLDEVWTFTSKSDGQVLNFTQLISLIDSANSRYTTVAAHLKNESLSLRASFTRERLVDAPQLAASTTFARDKKHYSVKQPAPWSKPPTPASVIAKQAFASQEVLTKIGDQANMSKTSVSAFLSSLPLDVDITEYPIHKLVEEIGEVKHDDPVRCVIEELQKPQYRPAKGKEREKPRPSQIYALKDDEIIQDYVVREIADLRCVYPKTGGRCIIHETCGSRISPPIENDPWLVRAALARAELAPAWFVNVYEDIRALGIRILQHPLQWAVTALAAFLAQKALISTVSWLFTSLMAPFFPTHIEPQAYSTTYAMIPKVSGRTMAVEKQGFSAFSTAPATDEWLLNKIAHNTVTVGVPTITNKLKTANMFSPELNIWYTVKHTFIDDPIHSMFCMFGSIAKTLPLREVKFTDWNTKLPIDDGLSVVWWCQLPKRDLVLIVTPRSYIINPDLTKFIVKDECPLETLHDMAMVCRPPHELQVDDAYNVLSSSNPPAHFHNFGGDVLGIHSYDIEDSPIGLHARCINMTADGTCGNAWLTRSTRAGRGVEKICAIQSCAVKSAGIVIGVPLTQEYHAAVKALIPLKNSIKIAFPPDFELNGGSIPGTNVVPLATLPVKQAANQNLRNTIRRSPAFDCLAGLEIYNPVTRLHEIIPAPARVPVDLRNPEQALVKMPLSCMGWSEEIIEDYRSAASHCSRIFLSRMDQKFIDRLYIPTWRQVINGDAEVDVPAIDMKTSNGYDPGNNLPGKKATFTQLADGSWEFKPAALLEAERLWSCLQNGETIFTLVVDNGKMELRLPGKKARNTDTYQAVVLTVAKRALYWIPALLKYGRIHNKTLYGVDLNSSEGSLVKTILDKHPYGNQGDMTNFDATIQPEQSMITFEDTFLPIHQELRRYGGTDLPDTGFLAAVRLQTHTLHIFGRVVYLRYFGNTSGGIFTTPMNMGVSLNNYLFAWKRYHRLHPKGNVWEEFEKLNSVLVYGDDYDATTEEEGFDNLFITACHKLLGQASTPAQKQTDWTPHVKVKNILKRSPWSQGIYTHWVLDMSTMSEIHAFIRDATVSKIEATRVCMESALMEWYHYTRPTYEAVLRRFNSVLALHRAEPITMTYDDLDAAFKAKYGVLSYAKQAITRDLPVRSIRISIPSVNINRVEQGIGAEQASFMMELPPNSTPSYPRGLTNCMAATPNPIANDTASLTSTVVGDIRTNESPIQNTVALTSHADDTTVATLAPPMPVASPAAQTDPYPDQGMDKVLSREYRIDDLTWAGEATGTLLGSWKFPQALFAIPNIAEKLKSFRYLRTGVRVSFRVNGSQFAGGTLAAVAIPFYDKDASASAWRHKFHAAMQAKPLLISATRADTVSLDISWMAPFQYLDLRSPDNDGMTGSVFLYVLNPLVWSNTGAPTGLSITVTASMLSPKVAGPDINGAPASLITKQSGEAIMKSVKGVVAGVSEAVKTVTGAVGPFMKMATMTFLDKPTSLAANGPYSHVPGKNLNHGKGLDLSVKLALDPEAQVSVDNGIFGGQESRPSWQRVLGMPGLIAMTNFDQTDAADTLIASWPVRPNYALKTGTTYFPTPLAYYSMFFKRWRGGITYAVFFAAPQNVTSRVRISFLPNVNATTAPPESQAGDIMSKVVSIQGDTWCVFTIEYLADTYMKDCSELSVADTSNDDAIGRVTISVLNEVMSVNTAAVTPVAVNVWMAAAPNFVYSKPDDFPDNWAPNFSTASITKQTSVLELFSKPVDGLVPTTLLTESGVVTPEKFTGILDLLHRFTIREVIENTSTTPKLLPPAPLSGTIKQYLMLPFLGYRGAWRFKLLPINASPPSAVVSRWDTPGSSNTVSWLSGAHPVNLTLSGLAEVEAPYYDTIAWRETWNIMTVPDFDTLEIQANNDGSLVVLEGAGDDFCLGPFTGCPPVTYTAPPPAKSSGTAELPISRATRIH